MNETNFTSMKTPGSIWINDNNNQLRFQTDVNSPTDWVTSVPIYDVAGLRNNETNIIKRGQPVSIAVDGEISAINGQSDKTTITPTNPAIHKKCIGIAMEPGSSGTDVTDYAKSIEDKGPWKKIHVQNTGYIHYKLENNDPTLCYIPPHTDKAFDWTYKDVGKTVYATTRGELTLSLEEAYKGGQDIISVGYLIDAPLEDTDPKFQKITVGIQPAGDIRGLVDSTEFLIKLDTIEKGSDLDITLSKYNEEGEPNGDIPILLYISSNENSELKALPFYTYTNSDDPQNAYTPIGVYIFKVPEDDTTKHLSELSGVPVLCTRLGKVSSNFNFNSLWLGKELRYVNGKIYQVGEFDNKELANINMVKSDEYIIGICLGSNELLVDCRRSKNILNFAPLGHIKPAYQTIENDDKLSYIIDPGYILMSPNKIYTPNKPVHLQKDLYDLITTDEKYSDTTFLQYDFGNSKINSIHQRINLLPLLKIIGLLDIIQVSNANITTRSIDNNRVDIFDESVTTMEQFNFVNIQATHEVDGKQVPWTIEALETFLSKKLFKFKGLYYNTLSDNRYYEVLSQIKYSSEGLPPYEQVPRWTDYISSGQPINKFISTNETQESLKKVRNIFELEDAQYDKIIEEYKAIRNFKISDYEENSNTIKDLLPNSKIIYSKTIKKCIKITTNVYCYGTIVFELQHTEYDYNFWPPRQITIWTPYTKNFAYSNLEYTFTDSITEASIEEIEEIDLLHEDFINYIKEKYNLDEVDILHTTKKNELDSIKFNNSTFNYTLIDDKADAPNDINNKIILKENEGFRSYLKLEDEEKHYQDYTSFNEKIFTFENDTKLGYLSIINGEVIHPIEEYTVNGSINNINIDNKSECNSGSPETELFYKQLENEIISQYSSTQQLRILKDSINYKTEYESSSSIDIYIENYYYKKIDFEFDNVSYEKDLFLINTELENQYPRNIINKYIIQNKPHLYELFNKKIVEKANINDSYDWWRILNPIDTHLNRIPFHTPLKFFAPTEMLPLLKDNNNLQDISERLLIKFYVTNPNDVDKNYPIEPGFTLLSPNEKEITLDKDYIIDGHEFKAGKKYPTEEIFKGFNYYITYEQNERGDNGPVINVYEVPKGQDQKYYRGIQNVNPISDDVNGDSEFCLYVQFKRSPKYYSEYHVGSELVDEQWKPYSYENDLITKNRIYFSDGKPRRVGADDIKEHPNDVYSYLDFQYVDLPNNKGYIIETNRYNNLKNDKQILKSYTDGLNEIKMLYELPTKSIYSDASLYFKDIKFSLSNPSYNLIEKDRKNELTKNYILKDGIYSAVMFNEGKINMLGNINFEVNEINKDLLKSNLSFEKFKEFFDDAKIIQEKFVNINEIDDIKDTYNVSGEWDILVTEQITVNNFYNFDTNNVDDNNTLIPPELAPYTEYGNQTLNDIVNRIMNEIHENNRPREDYINYKIINMISGSYKITETYKNPQFDEAAEPPQIGVPEYIDETIEYYYVKKIKYTLINKQKYDSFKVDSILLRHLDEDNNINKKSDVDNELILKTYNSDKFSSKEHLNPPKVDFTNYPILKEGDDIVDDALKVFITTTELSDNSINNNYFGYDSGAADSYLYLNKVGFIPERIHYIQNEENNVPIAYTLTPKYLYVNKSNIDDEESEDLIFSEDEPEKINENLNIFVNNVTSVIKEIGQEVSGILVSLFEYTLQDNIEAILKYNIPYLINKAFENYNEQIKDMKHNIPRELDDNGNPTNDFTYRKITINNSLEKLENTEPNGLEITPIENISLEEVFRLKVNLGEPISEDLIHYNSFLKNITGNKYEITSTTLFSLVNQNTTKKLLFIKLYDVDNNTSQSLIRFKIEKETGNPVIPFITKKDFLVKNSNIIIIDVTSLIQDYSIQINFGNVKIEGESDKKEITSQFINLYSLTEPTPLNLEFWKEELKFVEDNTIKFNFD